MFEESDKFMNIIQGDVLQGKTEFAESTDILKIWMNDENQNVSEEYYDQYIIDIAKKLHSQKTMVNILKQED